MGRGGRLDGSVAEAGDWLFCDLSKLRFKGERGGWLEPLALFPGPGDLLLELLKRALLLRVCGQHLLVAFWGVIRTGRQVKMRSKGVGE